MDELFGRRDECTELRAVLDRARRGMAAAVVLRGGPGSGKTALLDYVHHTSDPEFEVMRFDAVESEAELSYAGLLGSRSVVRWNNHFRQVLDHLVVLRREEQGFVWAGRSLCGCGGRCVHMSLGAGKCPFVESRKGASHRSNSDETENVATFYALSTNLSTSVEPLSGRTVHPEAFSIARNGLSSQTHAAIPI